MAFARPAKSLKTGDRLVFGQVNDRTCAASTLEATASKTKENPFYFSCNI